MTDYLAEVVMPPPEQEEEIMEKDPTEGEPPKEEVDYVSAEEFRGRFNSRASSKRKNTSGRNFYSSQSENYS